MTRSPQSTSSTSSSLSSNSSATNTTAQEAYMNQYSPPKPLTATQMRVQGDIQIKMRILTLIGCVCAILLIIGGIASLKDPSSASDVWVYIGPIITAAVTGVGAYFQGERNGQKK